MSASYLFGTAHEDGEKFWSKLGFYVVAAEHELIARNALTEEKVKVLEGLCAGATLTHARMFVEQNRAHVIPALEIAEKTVKKAAFDQRVARPVPEGCFIVQAVAMVTKGAPRELTPAELGILKPLHLDNSPIVLGANPDATTGSAMSIPLFSVLAVAAVGVLAVGFRLRRKAAQAVQPLVGEGYETLV